MLITLKRIRKIIFFGYEFSSNDNIIYTASVPLKLGRVEVILSDTEKILYKLTKKCIKNESGIEVGHITRKVSKFLFGYTYYKFVLDKIEYIAYAIGFGKEGQFVTIYKDDVQVALIEVPVVIQNSKPCYSIYIKDIEDRMAVLLFSLVYDIIRFSNTDSVAYNSTLYNYTRTHNKELKSKYDSSFKINLLRSVELTKHESNIKHFD